MIDIITVTMAEVRKHALQYFFQFRTLFWNVILPFTMVATFYFMYLPFVGKNVVLPVSSTVELPIIGFLVAGQVIYILYTNTLLGGGFFDDEREQQTLEMILLTPASRFAVLLGSSIAGLLLNLWMFVAVLLLIAIAPGVGVAIRDPFALVASLSLSAFALVSLGMCLACVYVLTRRGGQIHAAIQEPVDFLSGLRFPVSILPASLQAVASVLPLTYGIRAARLSMIGGATLTDVWSDLLALALMGFFLMLLAKYGVAVIERRAKHEGTLSLF